MSVAAIAAILNEEREAAQDRTLRTLMIGESTHPQPATEAR